MTVTVARQVFVARRLRVHYYGDDNETGGSAAMATTIFESATSLAARIAALFAVPMELSNPHQPGKRHSARALVVYTRINRSRS